MLEPNPSYHPHRHLEPFGEPRTMGDLWDLSSMLPSLHQASHILPSSEKDPNLAEDTSLKDQEEAGTWEKFPQPATFPSGWDLSELLLG
jgi:hypothetical protein